MQAGLTQFQAQNIATGGPTVIADALCDGSTDDAPAINKALGSLPATGGRVLIPGGFCFIGSPLNLTIGGTRIEGCGNGNTLLYQPTHNYDFISVQAGNCEVANIGFNAGAFGASQHWAINGNGSSDGLGIFNVRANTVHSFTNFISANLRMLKFDVLNIKPSTGVGIGINNSNATVIIGHGQIGNAPGSQAQAGILMTQATSVQLYAINLFKMGNALYLVPGVGQTVGNVYSIANFFDTSTNGFLADGSAAGAQVSAIDHIGCWFNGHASYGAKLTGTVKGVSFTGCQLGINGSDGLLLATAGVQDTIVNGSRAFANGGNGINVAANVNLFKLLGNTTGPFGGAGGNAGNGINVQTGSSDHFMILGNDAHGNTGSSIVNGGSGGNIIVADNLLT